MWEPLQATLDPGRGLPLLVGPLWWKGYRPRVHPKWEPKGTKRSSPPCRSMKVLFTAKSNLVRSYKYFNHVLKEARSHGALVMHLNSVSVTARTLFSSYRVKWTFMMSLGKHLLAVSCQFGATITCRTKNMIRSLLQQSSRQILLATAPNVA